MKKTFSVLATAALGVSMLAVPAFAAHEGTAYSGDLNALNGETGSGDAYIEVSEDGDTMSVSVNASDLELDFVHAMHIHGVFDGSLDDDPADGSFSASSCPTLAQDVGDENGGDPDPDGFVSVVEGAAVYGGVQVSLTTSGETGPGQALAVENFPSGTDIDYDRDITIPSALKDELSKVHIVVHGTDTDDSGDVSTEADENGDSTKFSTLDQSLPFDATAPALCGTLSAVSAGVVDTGAGGTATDTNSALALGLGGLALAGAVALRRRGFTS